MKRRDFLKSAIIISLVSSSGVSLLSSLKKQTKKITIPKYYGFNLLEKFTNYGGRKKFEEKDFEIMAELGFNFARIPMSYWCWSSPDNWYQIDEKILEDIDECIEFGKQYGIHINLNMHRIPGYCINGRDNEPMDLFDDSKENMQKALDAAIYHWKIFAKRYKDIPNRILSFDLINEPPHMKNESRYIEVVKALVKGIREESPDRLIFADGINVGRTPVFGIVDLGLVQSTRGYDPMSLTHYKATWVPPEAFQTKSPPTWPLKADNGEIWNKETLRKKLIDPWKPIMKKGVPVHVGEWGCYNKTPHEVCLKWMKDILSLWKEVNWGFALWNLRGAFGIFNSNRPDVKYENYKGWKLDRKMLELIKEYM